MSLKLLCQLVLDPIKAYQTTDIEDFKYLVDKTLKRLSRWPYYERILINALAQKYHDMNYEIFVTYLVAEGADLPSNRIYRNDFIYACKNGDTMLMTTVLDKHGQKLQANVCIYWACYGGHIPIIKMVIKHFKDKGKLDLNEGLRGANVNGSYDAAMFMLSKGANDWTEGLVTACRVGDIKLADDMLLHIKSDYHIAWTHGFNIACKNNHLPLVKHMLNNVPPLVSPINWKDSMYYAYYSGNKEIIEHVTKLIEPDWATCLRAACETGNMDLVHIAMGHIDSKHLEVDHDRGFPIACHYKHFDIAKLLIPTTIIKYDIPELLGVHIHSGDLYGVNGVLDLETKV